MDDVSEALYHYVAAAAVAAAAAYNAELVGYATEYHAFAPPYALGPNSIVCRKFVASFA